MHRGHACSMCVSYIKVTIVPFPLCSFLHISIQKVESVGIMHMNQEMKYKQVS